MQPKIIRTPERNAARFIRTIPKKDTTNINEITVKSKSIPSQTLGLFFLWTIVVAIDIDKIVDGRNIGQNAGKRRIIRIFTMLPPISNQKKANFWFSTLPTRLLDMRSIKQIRLLKSSLKTFGMWRHSPKDGVSKV